MSERRFRIMTIRLPTTVGEHELAIPVGAKRMGFRLLKPMAGDPAIVVMVPVDGELKFTRRRVQVVREGADFEENLDPRGRFGEWRSGDHYYHAFDAGECHGSEASEERQEEAV